MNPMVSSRHKPQRRNRRSQKNASSSFDARSDASSYSSYQNNEQRSYARSSYSSNTSDSFGNVVSAYDASKYKSSSHKSGKIPATPAAANSHYALSARDQNLLAAQRARKRKTKRNRIIAGSLAVVLALVLGGLGVAWAYFSQVDSALNSDLDADLLNALSVSDSASDPFYMLLVGIDKSEARESSGKYAGTYRTDTMILARIDPQQKTVTLVSIPRDTMVEIEDYGTQKINAAYAYGGASLAIETVSELAGVEISHYAEIDFDGFEAVVDGLGGIEVDVPMEIDDDEAGGHVDAGLQTLSGEEALILCRSRHTYDDYGDGDSMRAANQRLVIKAILEKAMDSDITTLTSTITTLADYVTTDFSATGIIGLAQSMMGIDVDENVYTASVPTESQYIDSLWYEVVQEDEWETMMERVDQGLSPTEETVVDEATGVTLSSAGDGGSSSSSSSSSSSTVSLSGLSVSVRNGSGVAGCASEAAATLTDMGAEVDTGNADDYNYDTTLIIYEDSDYEDEAEAIADALGVGTVTKDNGTYIFTSNILVVIGADWES